MPIDNHEFFSHIRIIVGMILGISMARLVGGAMQFLQSPGKKMDIYFIHFWWFEFSLLAAALIFQIAWIVSFFGTVSAN